MARAQPLRADPRDLARLVRPFVEDGADVVYGSRFLPSDRRRVLYFRHTLGNRFLTFLSNWFTDLNLTDMETCYKMFRAPLLKSIPIRSNDFAIEPEITAKVAKRDCRIFEVPISYLGRTYREGKKIGLRDGFKALSAILRYWLVDDLSRSPTREGTPTRPLLVDSCRSGTYLSPVVDHRLYCPTSATSKLPNDCDRRTISGVPRSSLIAQICCTMVAARFGPPRNSSQPPPASVTRCHCHSCHGQDS